jgi:hypothetical protein
LVNEQAALIRLDWPHLQITIVVVLSHPQARIWHYYDGKYGNVRNARDIVSAFPAADADEFIR